MHVKYLGHVVGSGELSVDRNKVAAVADWQQHTNVGCVVVSRICELL